MVLQAPQAHRGPVQPKETEATLGYLASLVPLVTVETLGVQVAQDGTETLDSKEREVTLGTVEHQDKGASLEIQDTTEGKDPKEGEVILVVRDPKVKLSPGRTSGHPMETWETPGSTELQGPWEKQAIPACQAEGVLKAGPAR